MAATARKLAPIDDAQFVTVDEAAALTGLTVRRWRQIALEKSTSFPSAGLSRLAASRSGLGKPVWWVHRSLDRRLDRVQDDDVREDRTVATLLEAGHAKHSIDRAIEKAKWMHRWRSLCSTSPCSGVAPPQVARTDLEWAAFTVGEAKREEEGAIKISARSLQQWFAAYYSIDPATGHIRGLGALIDKYVTADNRQSTARSPEAIDYFYSLYHSQVRRSIKVCHRTTLREAQRAAWSWPSGYASTVRWLDQTDDLSATMLLREGRHEWAKRYRPFIEMDDSHLEPGEWFMADHHRCDFWVLHNGKQLRPWLTAILDLRSRCIVGWHLGTSPHQDAIIAALRHAFLNWSIPKALTVDNGRDFRAKRLQGLDKGTLQRLQRELGDEWENVHSRTQALIDCEGPWIGLLGELGIRTHFAIPYSPYSKGPVERWFGTFEGQCGKSFVTYCGNDTAHKPDFVESLRADMPDADMPTLESARTEVAAYLEEYHRTAHGGRDMNGLSPLLAWNTAASLRRADEDALLLLMEGRGTYKVGANGVTLTVGGQSVSFGATSPALARMRGREVFISMGDDVSHCWAFTADRENRRLLGRLPCNERVARGVTSDAIREVGNEVRREQAAKAKVERSTIRRHRSVVARANEETVARRAELKATGTDDVAVANIVAVHTGFEGISRAVRNAPDVPRLVAVDTESYGDFFNPDNGEEREVVPLRNDSEDEGETEFDSGDDDSGDGSDFDEFMTLPRPPADQDNTGAFDEFA